MRDYGKLGACERKAILQGIYFVKSSVKFVGFLFAIFLLSGFFWGGDVRADNRLPCSASGVFHKCYGSKVTAEGHYKGTWQDDRFHGEGTLTYADGDTYIGGFKDGKQDGKGTQIYANGDRYIGEWRNGNKDGKGTQIYANGDKYIGEWRNGNKDGKATQIYANGDIYVGEWSESKKSGDGRLIYADGDKHEDIIKKHAQDHLDNPAPPVLPAGYFITVMPVRSPHGPL